jgi:hypothetical protein
MKIEHHALVGHASIVVRAPANRSLRIATGKFGSELDLIDTFHVDIRPQLDCSVNAYRLALRSIAEQL